MVRAFIIGFLVVGYPFLAHASAGFDKIPELDPFRKVG